MPVETYRLRCADCAATLPGGLSAMTTDSGTLIAYAASPGQVGRDGEGRNSPYMKQLKYWLNLPNMRIVDVLRQVRLGVLQETNGTQEPDYDDKLKAPFYLYSTTNYAD